MLTGQGSLLDQQQVIVHERSRRAKRFNREFALYDSSGVEVGAVRQLRRNPLLQRSLARSFEIVDGQGHALLVVTRPTELMMSRLIVDDGQGNRLGEVVQYNIMSGVRFAFEVDGTEVGELVAENWLLWDIAIKDPGGTRVAHVTKEFEGAMRDLFTSAEHHRVEVPESLDDPLRVLAFAAAVTYHLALHYDAGGVRSGCVLDLFGEFSRPR